MIYEGSRYLNTDLYKRGEATVFERRELYTFSSSSVRHTVSSTDTLDTLAYQYYGDTQLWWVILEANPSYAHVFDINVGDVLIIPSREEVINLVK